MVLRLLAANAEHWLAHQLNAYLQDPNEYRATTRNLLHLGGTITYTPDTINVHLDRPATPKITRALALLTDQLNTNPPQRPPPHYLHHHHTVINIQQSLPGGPVRRVDERLSAGPPERERERVHD